MKAVKIALATTTMIIASAMATMFRVLSIILEDTKEVVSRLETLNSKAVSKSVTTMYK